VAFCEVKSIQPKKAVMISPLTFVEYRAGKVTSDIYWDNHFWQINRHACEAFEQLREANSGHDFLNLIAVVDHDPCVADFFVALCGRMPVEGGGWSSEIDSAFRKKVEKIINQVDAFLYFDGEGTLRSLVWNDKITDSRLEPFVACLKEKI